VRLECHSSLLSSVIPDSDRESIKLALFSLEERRKDEGEKNRSRSIRGRRPLNINALALVPGRW